MTNNILITGGSGFIGNQIVHELFKHGHQLTVIDRKIKHWAAPASLYEGDFLNYLENNDTQFDTIIHLAAEHLVEQSVTEPAKYYENNVIKMKAMLDIMVTRGIKNIIFSSSGAIYGKQGEQHSTLTEDLHYNPENTYASTKVAGEMLIQDYAKAYGINYINFRYFNAAGADPNGQFGYIQSPATHVIPILCNKISSGEVFRIFGNDYLTYDKTCVRDYVHVVDIARAHQSAIEYLNCGGKSDTFNIGGLRSLSINELVSQAAIVVNKVPKIEYLPRRSGDSSALVADITKIKKILNWKPIYNIADIIQHAWNWEIKKGKI